MLFSTALQVSLFYAAVLCFSAGQTSVHASGQFSGDLWNSEAIPEDIQAMVDAGHWASNDLPSPSAEELPVGTHHFTQTPASSGWNTSPARPFETTLDSMTSSMTGLQVNSAPSPASPYGFLGSYASSQSSQPSSYNGVSPLSHNGFTASYIGQAPSESLLPRIEITGAAIEPPPPVRVSREEDIDRFLSVRPTSIRGRDESYRRRDRRRRTQREMEIDAALLASNVMRESRLPPRHQPERPIRVERRSSVAHRDARRTVPRVRPVERTLSCLAFKCPETFATENERQGHLENVHAAREVLHMQQLSRRSK